MERGQEKQFTAGGYVVALRDISMCDAAIAGGKAANLGELMHAGMPVPDGFVLTSSAFQHFVLSNSITADASSEVVMARSIPNNIAEALSIAAARLGGNLLAVRSSGLAEDLPHASFAGQYETVLNVRGVQELLAAVLRCWSSAFSNRVARYRKAQGQQELAPMAVLVQSMVSADAAGVAFTANPVTGDRTETVVSAVRGLGERLVSGQASPDEWMVKGHEAECHSIEEDAISAEQALAVANLARRAEAHFGVPQDVEWAIAGDQLFLLQARPITTLPDETHQPIPAPGPGLSHPPIRQTRDRDR